MGLYSHYDGAHSHPVNRALHMIAIPVGFFYHRDLVSLDHRPAADSRGVCPRLARALDRRQQACIS